MRGAAEARPGDGALRVKMQELLWRFAGRSEAGEGCFPGAVASAGFSCLPHLPPGPIAMGPAFLTMVGVIFPSLLPVILAHPSVCPKEAAVATSGSPCGFLEGGSP